MHRLREFLRKTLATSSLFRLFTKTHSWNRIRFTSALEVTFSCFYSLLCNRNGFHRPSNKSCQYICNRKLAHDSYLSGNGGIRCASVWEVFFNVQLKVMCFTMSGFPVPASRVLVPLGIGGRIYKTRKWQFCFRRTTSLVSSSTWTTVITSFSVR